MKIFLIGASGMVGSRILAEAVARDHVVVAGARDPSKIAVHKDVAAVKIDVAESAAMAQYARTADVIVSAVSPRSGGDPVTEAIANGAAVMAAAAAADKRLMMVGGAGSLNLPDGGAVLDHVPEIYKSEATGLKAVYTALKTSTLDWTFFAPAAMIAPGARTGKFRLGKDVLITAPGGESKISAEDYAVAMLDELERPSFRKSIMTIGY